MTTPNSPALRRLVAAIAAAALVATAAADAASSITLKSEHADALGATVLAAPSGRTLYRLSGETTHHLLCRSRACLGIWHPLTVRSKSTFVHLPQGAKGYPRLMRRGHAYQVVIGSRPLYTYAGDGAAGQATGDGIKSFGGTWHSLAIAKDAMAPAPAPAQPAPYPSGY